MRVTSSIQFYCRDSKKNKQGYSPIECSLIINGERKFINLPRKEKPEEFNKKRKSKDIQDYLDLMHSQINSIMTDMLRYGEPLTVNSLREYLKNGGYKSYTINDLFSEYLNIIKARVGKDMSKGTYRKYELVSELFLQMYEGTKEASTITSGMVTKYYASLKDKYESATAAGYMTKLKTFITYALDNNKLQINPFATTKITKEKKPIDYLTEAEINKLMTTPIENESLSKVRDCAVFQICSGIAYCDIVALQPEDMKEDNGVYYINKRRQKTGTEFTAVILPQGVEIWNKYEGRLPIISNQKYNCYLKTIGTLCDLKTSLHSHLFRHSYCTLLLNRGVSLKTIAKCAGHASSKVTESFYAHLEDKTVLNEVTKAFQ